MVELNSIVTKKGGLGCLGRGSICVFVLTSFFINFCDKESASSLLTAELKKENEGLLSGKEFQSFSSFHHLSFCLYCYNEIISLFKSYRSFDHWCAMAEFLPHFVTVKRTNGKNLTSVQSFKLSIDCFSCFWLFSILALWYRL